MNIIRSVFARVFILITALGQNITTHSIGTDYYGHIAIANFLYGVSLTVAIVFNSMAQNHNISDNALLAAEVPNHVLNFVIAIWILVAFKQTISTLN